MGNVVTSDMYCVVLLFDKLVCSATIKYFILFSVEISVIITL